MAAGFPTKNNWVAGDVLTASALDDLASTVNYCQFMTPRNAVINGAFDFWQRGTTFSNPANGAYTADRFDILYDGTGATRTISQQAFTPGAAPVAGYESSYFFRFALSAVGTGNTTNVIEHRIEDVRSFAGQTVTVSFFAKFGSAANVGVYLLQNFGSGGSTQVSTTLNSSQAIGTTWTRYTFTATLPSIAGKTIGTSSYLNLYLALGGGSTFTFDYWGVQVEAGSAANTFMRNGTSLQAELAACQRYYYQINSNSAAQISGTANLAIKYYNPVLMRVAPTATTNMNNGNFGTLWNLYPIGSSAVTKTGTATLATAGTVDGCLVTIAGATWSSAPQQFSIESTGQIYLNSEL